LAEYVLPLQNLRPDALIDRFQQLENDLDRLKPRLKAEVEKYRRELDVLYATLLDEAETMRGADPSAHKLLSELEG
jgi:hypothetical protein